MISDVILSTEYDERDKLEGFQRIDVTLSPGTFWRLKDGGKTVYLMSDCKIHEDEVHTVVIAEPPVNPDPAEVEWGWGAIGGRSKEYLTKEFLSYFEQVGEAEAGRIREKELGAIQGKIDELSAKAGDQDFLQKEAMAIFQDQHVKLESKPADKGEANKYLPSTQVVNNQAIVGIETKKNLSVIITEVIQGYVKKIESQASLMTNFMQEKAEVSLAKHKHIVKGVGKMGQKIETLRLYSGDNVSMKEIKSDGSPAPSSEKIHFLQRLLYLDEESLINTFFGGAGASRDDAAAFFDALTNDKALLERVCPFPKCVVSIQYRRHPMSRDAESIADAYFNDQLEKMDKESFLLVRNGENLFAIFSPVKMLSRLFPSKAEMDEVFNVWDNQFGRDRVTFDSVDFVDAMERNEEIANHYTNLQLVIVGAYERNPQIFSPLAGESDVSVNLLSYQAQRELVRYIYDDQNVLVNHDYLPVKEWLSKCRKNIRPGSRVVLDGNYFDNDIAPGLSRYNRAYGGGRGWYNEIAKLDDESSYFIVKEQKGRPYIEVEAVRTGYSDAEGERFMAKVYLTDSYDCPLKSAFCVDNTALEELEYYLNDRASREHYLDYVSVVRKAHEILTEEKPAIDEVVANLKQSLENTELVLDDKTLFRAISHWRIGNKGEMPPRTYKEVGYRDFVNQVTEILYHEKNDRTQQALNLGEEAGYTPLQVCMDDKGNWTLYREVLDAEWEKIAPVVSNLVARHKLKIQKKGIRLDSPTFVTPTKISAKEQVKWKTSDSKLHELWFRKHDPSRGEYSDFIEKFQNKWRVYNQNYGTIESALSVINSGGDFVTDLSSGKLLAQSDVGQVYSFWLKEVVNKKAGRFSFMSITIPFAMLGDKIVTLYMGEEVFMTWFMGADLGGMLEECLDSRARPGNHVLIETRRLNKLMKKGVTLDEMVELGLVGMAVWERKGHFGRLKKALNFSYPGVGELPVIRSEYLGGGYVRLNLDECRQVSTLLRGQVPVELIVEKIGPKD